MKKKKPKKIKEKVKKKNWLFYALMVFLLAIVVFFLYLLRKPEGYSQNFEWNIAFSKIWSARLGLDWQANYLAILDELKPKKIRLPIYWQEVESSEGNFNFVDYDWMNQEAEKRGIETILVVGRKTPRWPECNMPEWVKARQMDEQKKAVLKMLPVVVNHYKNFKNVVAFQVENEPFLNFGDCPLFGGDFLDQEIALVKMLDKNRPIIVTDSGELSYWLQAAKRADIFGTTMYRVVNSPRFGYVEYPFPPRFFWFKANLVHLFYPGKPITISELQAEPWGEKMIYDMSVPEQMKSMDLARFNSNIAYAKEVGFSEIYLWGAEWWYWMKVHENRPEYWEGARRMIESSK